MTRRLLDEFDGFLRGARRLIHDRDPLFGGGFGDLLRSAGVTPVRLPARSPNLNAYAERFVRSIKEECLNRLIIFGESHLRIVIDEYVEHYHRERPHQGLNNLVLEPPDHPPKHEGPVVCRERIGGLLRSYHRSAA